MPDDLDIAYLQRLLDAAAPRDAQLVPVARAEMELRGKLTLSTIRDLFDSFTEAAAALDAKDAQIAALRAQLPKGMEHCAIRFLECEQGHGRLTATNWVPKECPWCQLNAARAVIDEIRQWRQIDAIAEMIAAYDALVKEPPSDAG